MTNRSRAKPRIVPAMAAMLALAAGSLVMQSVQSAPGPGMGMGMGGMGGGMGQTGGPGSAMQGQGQGQGKHRHGLKGGGPGKHGKHGQKRCAKHLFGGPWTQSLNDEQKGHLDQLHVNHARIKAPLKARIKALKVDLAVLATAPEPDKAAIDAKIQELVSLKGQLLGAEYGYVAAQRRVLTPAQQVSFDMDTIHGAMHGKKGKGGHGGKH